MKWSVEHKRNALLIWARKNRRFRSILQMGADTNLTMNISIKERNGVSFQPPWEWKNWCMFEHKDYVFCQSSEPSKCNSRLRGPYYPPGWKFMITSTAPHSLLNFFILNHHPCHAFLWKIGARWFCIFSFNRNATIVASASRRSFGTVVQNVVRLITYY